MPNSVFFDTLKNSWPEVLASARINNPWGHMRVGVVVRDTQMDDGQYLNQSFIGYGGTVSGDVHPFSGTPGPLGKDDLGFGTTHGTNLGGQVGNGVGPSTNFGAAIYVPGLGLSTHWRRLRARPRNTRREFPRRCRAGQRDQREAGL